MKKHTGDLVYFDAENTTLRPHSENDPDEFTFYTRADLRDGDVVVLDLVNNEVVAVATGPGQPLVQVSFPLKVAKFVST